MESKDLPFHTCPRCKSLLKRSKVDGSLICLTCSKSWTDEQMKKELQKDSILPGSDQRIITLIPNNGKPVKRGDTLTEVGLVINDFLVPIAPDSVRVHGEEGSDEMEVIVTFRVDKVTQVVEIL